MQRILPLIFLFFLIIIPANAQNFTIKGKVMSKEVKMPVESATVYLTKAQDSSMIDYTISDKNGNFSIPIRKQTEPFIVKLSMIGYEVFEKRYESLESDIDMGEIFISDDVTTLGEVLVVGEAPPVRIKNDTLEFNASSFKVRPDSNVEALLKQLPGVEINKDGKITVNGKEVNEILVNGKSFFGKDGQVAIKNLPAEIINKVQVSDTKTKEEKQTGQGASGDKASINLTIQDDKNKGLFGKFTGGYGTDDRYEASGLLNYFKDKQKLSFLGASNNINSTGFSMDEIFDSMGGGRNRSVYSRGDGSFNINGIDFGGGSGITTSNMIGLNYSDEWFTKFDPSASYFFTNSTTENDTRSRTESFLTNADGTNSSFITESIGSSENVNDGHNMSFEFEYKIDSLTTLNVTPSFVKNNSEFRSRSQQSSSNDLGLVNESNSENVNNTENSTLQNDLYLNRRFKKKGRSLGIAFNHSNKNSDIDNVTNSETYFFQDPERTEDIRRQKEQDGIRDDRYYVRLGFSEPLRDSLNITIRAAYEWKDYSMNKNTYNFNETSEAYDDFNSLLSYSMDSRTTIFNPSAAINLRKKNISGGIHLGTDVTHFDNGSLFDGTESKINKKYMYPSANAWLSYRMSKSKSLYFYYDFDVKMPTAMQILPVADLTNPLFQRIGNANLEPTKTHNFHLNFNNYDYASRSGFYSYFGFSFNERAIVTSRVFDVTDLINRTTYENVENTYYGYGGISWNKTIKKEENTFRFGAEINLNVNYDKGLTNNLLYTAKGYTISPTINLGWDLGEILTISPSYTYTFDASNYTNYSIDKASNFLHNIKLQTTSYWPKHVVFGNDFGYTYNSNISGGFRKDFFLWNTSLGYNFFEDKLLFKVKVYDMLNQNQSAMRYISPESIRDVENTVLKRYAMFSLTYKIEKFGGEKERNRFEP